MSGHQLSCPMCNAVLQLASAPVPGARTKCPRCGTPFALDAPASYSSPPPPPLLPAPAPAPARPKAAVPAIQEAPRRRAKPILDDLDEVEPAEDADAQPTTSSLSLGLILGASGVGVVALAVIVVLVIWGVNRGKNNNNNQTQVVTAEEPWVSPPVGPRAKESWLLDAPKDTKPVADPKPPTDAKSSGDVLPSGDGALSAELLRKVKAATLYVKVQMGDGRSASGSGFFEQSTGLILTNAHVVGMLRTNAPPPRKVEVVFNSGIEGETPLNAELVSVDREADLALLRVQLSPTQADKFPRLTVSPAKDLLETQPVYVVGFPFGEKINRNVTISATTVSSMHRGADGVLTKVQVNGGMHPGNSGGPVIDGHGNVIGVSVAGIPGTQINFAIPGEIVQSFIHGRVAEVLVSTDAVLRNGKLVVPVQIMAVDPRRRITRIALDYWTGPERPNPIPPSDRPPKLGDLSSPRQTVVVTFDSERSQGTAELVLDAMPGRGMRLWIQPVVTNGTGDTSWLSGMFYTLSPAVEEKPATLTARPRAGKGTVQLTSTSRFRFEMRDGKEKSYLQDLQARLSEQTAPVGQDGACVHLGIEKFTAEISINGSAVATTEKFKTATKRDVMALAIDMRVDAKGNPTAKRNDLTRVPMPSREILTLIGEQIQQSFDIVAIPQPGQVKPGETWQAKRDLPLDMPDSFQTAVMNVTYTYRGQRDQDGRKVAVVELRGALVGDRGNESLAAKMTGTALIDLTTGIVIKANALTDAALTIKIREESIYATGTLEVKLSRAVDDK